MSEIFLRRTYMHDLPAIVNIIDEARQALKRTGNPQWQDGQPTRATIVNDITHHLSWVLVVDGQIAGVATLQPSPEASYEKIITGHWVNRTDPYLVIHRVALGDRFRGQGLSTFLLSNLITVGLIKGVRNFRLGTHRTNKAMQGAAQSAGFQRRGMVRVIDYVDPSRLAFELNLANPQLPTQSGVTNDFMKPLIKK